MVKVVHYLNQFFSGIGGEDKADTGPQVREGPIGPGRAIQNALGDKGKVVATVICGDNYFAQDIEKASAEVIDLAKDFKPDLLLAGPAFNAGRYGIACGGVCKAVTARLGIPAVAGMNELNPGLDLYRYEVYVVPTEDSVRGMNKAVAAMVELGLKLASGKKIGRPSDDGYFPRGHLVNETSDRTGAERAVTMMLKKVNGQPFESEVSRPKYDHVAPAFHILDLHEAKIALVTDGGLVPKGNPDGIESKSATRFGKYSIKGKDSLQSGEYEVVHVGYDPVFVTQNPNRLVPVDVMRDLEREGAIGKLHETFYATTGVANVVETMRQLGQSIAAELKAEGVSGAILTST